MCSMNNLNRQLVVFKNICERKQVCFKPYLYTFFLVYREGGAYLVLDKSNGVFINGSLCSYTLFIHNSLLSIVKDWCYSLLPNSIWWWFFIGLQSHHKVHIKQLGKRTRIRMRAYPRIRLRFRIGFRKKKKRRVARFGLEYCLVKEKKRKIDGRTRLRRYHLLWGCLLAHKRVCRNTIDAIEKWGRIWLYKKKGLVYLHSLYYKRVGKVYTG